jgi:anti-sigma factor RsiW
VSPDIHILVGAYALDAVDDIERAAFERHLDECEPCRIEAAELREAAARLGGEAWSVPPPTLRANVMADIAKTRQTAVAVRAPVAVAHRRRAARWLAAAAAVVVAAGGAGTAVYLVQDQRVRHEQALAEAARASETRVRSILAAPDLVVHEKTLVSGGRVTVATSRLADAGVIMLAADGAPAGGKVYQLWTIRSGTPASAGALGTGQAAVVRIVEGLPGSSAVGVTLEPAPGSTTPTAPLDALVDLA